RGGALFLGGRFSLADLGDFQRAGGFLYFTGILENAGRTLALDDQTGAWLVRGGTINGGTIRTSRDRLLQVITSADQSPARLHGVTVEGFLNIFSNTVVTGGLTNNGTIAIGSAFGNERGMLTFDGSQVLGGSGTVVLAGDVFNNLLGATRGTVTI